jgi:hypothetical protein
MENLAPQAVDVIQILVWNGCMQHTEKLRKDRIYFKLINILTSQFIILISSYYSMIFIISY